MKFLIAVFAAMNALAGVCGAVIDFNDGWEWHVPKKAKLSEGSRADCGAIERTSEAKWPQGAARGHGSRAGASGTLAPE